MFTLKRLPQLRRLAMRCSQNGARSSINDDVNTPRDLCLSYLKASAVRTRCRRSLTTNCTRRLFAAWCGQLTLCLSNLHLITFKKLISLFRVEKVRSRFALYLTLALISSAVSAFGGYEVPDPQYAAPTSYYTNATSTVGATLKSQLHTIEQRQQYPADLFRCVRQRHLGQRRDIQSRAHVS